MGPTLGALALRPVSSRASRSYPYVSEPGWESQDLPLLRGEAWGGWLVTRLVTVSALWLLLGAFAAGLLALGGLWRPWVAGRS